ncbi:hypothetical protein HQ585_01475 [candidate division KSB1 bacterium]|nr:hypothetical protein [candidate division KSB1 bacterium]
MWQSLSIDEYAELERGCGSIILQYGDVWWRRVRPFLFRPLDPFKSTSCDAIRPHLGPLTAVQHYVSDNEVANSHFNLLVFDQFDDYCIENLRKHHRRYLREAVRNEIEFKHITDCNDLSADLHKVYLAFYRRSRYTFNKNRLQQKYFNQWITCHINQSKAEVIAAFHQGIPVGIYITCLVDDTLVWKTAVNAPTALKLRVPDLLLHNYHEQAKNQPEIKRIFCGYYSAGSGLDTFKLRRGAKIITLPTHLRTQPWILRLSKMTYPSAYRNLVGLTPEQILAITSK